MSNQANYRSSISILFLHALLYGGHVRAQDGADPLKPILSDLQAIERMAQYYSAELQLEDPQIELRGQVEFLKGSQVFSGEFRNKPTSLVPSSPWAPIEFGLYGADSQIYYPDRRRCEIYTDAPNRLPSQFPVNPLLLFAQKRLNGLTLLLQMPGEFSTESLESESLESPKRTIAQLSFPTLIALGEQAGIHHIRIMFNESRQPLEVELRGGGLGNFTALIAWEQNQNGVWYPQEQKLFEAGKNQAVDINGRPAIYCLVNALTTELRDFKYLPRTTESRLPFGTQKVRYSSSSGKTSNQSVTTEYVGGKEGELQHNLDSIAEGLRAMLEVKN